MRKYLSLAAACALSAMPALAQTTPAPPARPAVETPPLPGANSFTRSQARARIEAAGYSSLTALAKDDQGIWHCTAVKGGKTVKVSLDYKGNVTES